MNTTPEEFQRRLASAKRHAVYQLLFVLVQIAAVLAFAVICRALPALSYYAFLCVLTTLTALSIAKYVNTLRFLSVYSRCVALVTRFDKVPVEQANLRLSLQEQLEAEVEKLSMFTGIRPRVPDENVPD